MARLESPDEVLVMAAILGDLEAFEELVLRYRAAVVRLALTIVGSNYSLVAPFVLTTQALLSDRGRLARLRG